MYCTVQFSLPLDEIIHRLDTEAFDYPKVCKKMKILFATANSTKTNDRQ